jgi:hypothetical protein
MRAEVTIEKGKNEEGILFEHMPDGAYGIICYTPHASYIGVLVMRTNDRIVPLNNPATGNSWPLPAGSNRVKLLKKGDAITITITEET